MVSWKKDLPPPSPTGCEYYHIFPTAPDSRSQGFSYDMQRIPVEPNRFNHAAVEARLLDGLEREKIAVIEELLQERNSRTVKGGEWVVIGLNIIPAAPEGLRLVIQFYCHDGQLDEGETCQQRKKSEEEHHEAVVSPEQNVGGNGSEPGEKDTIASTSVSSGDSPGHHSCPEETGSFESDGVPIRNEEHSEPVEAIPSSIAIPSNSNTLTGELALTINGTEYLQMKGFAAEKMSEKQWNEAERLLRHMLEIQDETLVALEKEKFQTMHELADNTRQTRRYHEAITLYVSTLEGRTRVLGENHEDTLRTMHNLALCYYWMQQKDRAKPLFKRCLEGRGKIFGDYHADTLDTIHYLANCYGVDGEYGEETELLQRCLEGKIKVLGKQHVDTLQTMFELAHGYKDSGRREEAVKMFASCFEHRRRILGENHENTLQTALDLGRTYESLDMLQDAEAVYKLWRNSPNNFKYILHTSLVCLYQRQSRYEEAKKIQDALYSDTD